MLGGTRQILGQAFFCSFAPDLMTVWETSAPSSEIDLSSYYARLGLLIASAEQGVAQLEYDSQANDGQYTSAGGSFVSRNYRHTSALVLQSVMRTECVCLSVYGDVCTCSYENSA